MDKKNIKARQPPSLIPNDLAFKRTIKKPKSKRFVRLFPDEKKKADEHRAYLDHMKRRAWLEEHHPRALEKLLKLEHEKNRRATDKELQTVIQESLFPRFWQESIQNKELKIARAKNSRTSD